MDVIALVNDIETRIEGLQASIVFIHAHAPRRHAITRQGPAIQTTAGVVAVRNTTNVLVVRWRAIGGRDLFPGYASRGESHR